LRSGIAEGGRGVTNSRPSRTLSADIGTFDGRALRSGIAEGGRGVKPVSPCPCASRWAAYALIRESAEKAEPPVARAAMTASPISKRFMMPSRYLAASMYAHAADICSAGRLLTVKIDGFRRPRSGASRHVCSWRKPTSIDRALLLRHQCQRCDDAVNPDELAEKNRQRRHAQLHGSDTSHG